MSKPWTVADARHTYAVAHWGDGYVDVNEAGEIAVRPQGARGPTLSLPAIVERARAEGLRLPLLVRFPDILADRLARLQAAFAKAIASTAISSGLEPASRPKPSVPAATSSPATPRCWFTLIG